jgi:hypothetical protein
VSLHLPSTAEQHCAQRPRRLSPHRRPPRQTRRRAIASPRSFLTDHPEFPTTGETSFPVSPCHFFSTDHCSTSTVDSFLNHRPALPVAYQCCRTMSLLNLLHPDAVAALLELCVQRLCVAEQGREKLANKMMIELSISDIINYISKKY